jgi:hypothetical protein
MKKRKLAIDIDEVLRAKWLAFDRYYADEFGEEGIKEPFDTYELMNHYEFKETEEVTQMVTDEFLNHEGLAKLSPKEYVVDQETGRAPVDDFAFNTEKKILSAQEVFDKFLYEDFLFEIHGSAPKLYLNADVDLNVFMKRYSEYFDFVFFSKVRKEAIPATLFFLSKMRIEVKNILFVYDNQELWDQVNWVLTTDPTIMLDKPKDKIVVKMERLYNIETPADYSAFGVSTLNEEITPENPNEFLEFVKNNTKGLI